jgi:hypothetical protein
MIPIRGPCSNANFAERRYPTNVDLLKYAKLLNQDGCEMYINASVTVCIENDYLPIPNRKQSLIQTNISIVRH